MDEFNSHNKLSIIGECRLLILPIKIGKRSSCHAISMERSRLQRDTLATERV